jgi:hypothetical protein
VFEQPLYVNRTLTRAFVWKEMLERGFYLPAQLFIEYNDAQTECGRRLLETELPAAYDACALPDDGALDNIRKCQPFLWERLPGMLAFGYTQGRLIHGLRLGAKRVTEPVALAAAIFNMGIAIFDFVVDELPAGKNLFNLVNPGWLTELLDVSRELPLDGLVERMRHTGPLEGFLLKSIVAFTENCKRLYMAGAERLDWDRLRASLDELYEAELTASTGCHAPVLTDDAWMEILYRKSALPTTTIAMISQLASPPGSGVQEQAVLDACDTLGRIFWLLDDLSDIASDARKGLPSYVILRGTTPRDDRSMASVRQGVIGTAEDLCCLLRQLEDILDSLTAPAAVSNEVLRFARMSVYSWLTG